MGPILALEKVSVMRGERRVLRDVSCHLPAGYVLLLRGHNGSGKTTLIRAIAGLIPLLEGSIRLDGGGEDLTVGERCHLVGHANATKQALTVRENLLFWSRFLGGTRDAVERAIDRFSLRDLAEIPLAMLSAGQKRRTGLARLLVAQRRLWLLDEPTTSLDAASTGLLTAVVNEHLNGGGLAVVATHVDIGIQPAQTIELHRGAVTTSSTAGDIG